MSSGLPLRVTVARSPDPSSRGLKNKENKKERCARQVTSEMNRQGGNGALPLASSSFVCKLFSRVTFGFSLPSTLATRLLLTISFYYAVLFFSPFVLGLTFAPRVPWFPAVFVFCYLSPRISFPPFASLRFRTCTFTTVISFCVHFSMPISDYSAFSEFVFRCAVTSPLWRMKLMRRTLHHIGYKNLYINNAVTRHVRSSMTASAVTKERRFGAILTARCTWVL